MPSPPGRNDDDGHGHQDDFGPDDQVPQGQEKRISPAPAQGLGLVLTIVLEVALAALLVQPVGGGWR